MQSPSTTPRALVSAYTTATDTTTPRDQHARHDAPDRAGAKQTPYPNARDVPLNFFDPAWASDSPLGAVVHPETHASESFPHYDGERTPRFGSVGASRFWWLWKCTPEPAPGSVIDLEEIGDDELQEWREREKALAELDKWRRCLPYGPAAFQLPESLGSVRNKNKEITVINLL